MDTRDVGDAVVPVDSPQVDASLEANPDAIAPAWQTIDGYAGGMVNTFNLQVGSDGTLFLAVSKAGPVTSQIVTVEAYDGSLWRPLGADRPISAFETPFALGPDDTPYLFNDGRIERFRNGQWSNVPQMPSGRSVPWNLAAFGFDQNGWLHVPMHDTRSPPSLGVTRWNGTVWEPVGGNANLGPAWGSKAFISFNLSHTYLAVSDTDKLNSSVWRFSGTVWEPLLGDDGAPPAGQMVVTRNGKVYLASSRGLSVVHWTDGPGWQLLPSPALKGNVWDAVDPMIEPSIALGPDDSPYVAYVGDREPGPDIVMGPLVSRWDGTQWIDVPMTGLAPTNLARIQLAIDRRVGNTILYLAFSRSGELVIRKLGATSQPQPIP